MHTITLYFPAIVLVLFSINLLLLTAILTTLSDLKYNIWCIQKATESLSSDFEDFRRIDYYRVS